MHITNTDSETDEERAEVSDFVKNYVEETKDISSDSELDSGSDAKVIGVSETDPYETASQTDEPDEPKILTKLIFILKHHCNLNIY